MGVWSVLTLCLLYVTAVQGMSPRPHCRKRCGKVDIPYPFGIGDNCSLPGLDHFTVVCNHSHYKPPRPFIGDYEITGVVLEKGELNARYTQVPYICYSSPNTTSSELFESFNLSGSPFLVSATANKFTAVGCDTLATIRGRKNLTYLTGCITYCSGIQEAAPDGSPCTGLGCCEADLTPGLSYLDVSWNSENTNYASSYSPCSYAFIANKDWYSFKQADLSRHKNDFVNQSIPLVLDWAIRINGSSCPLQSSKTANPVVPYGACVSNHSYCVNVTTRDQAGYLCNCSEGYQGNPYINGTGGCTNINECELRRADPERYKKLYPCYAHSKCLDTDGGYDCKCNFGRRGNGKIDDLGCHSIIPAPYVATLATVCAVVALLVLVWFIRREHKRWMQKGYLDSNGGRLLEGMDITIFTESELDEITEKKSDKIGEGNFGVVYKGTHNNQKVAVKYSKRITNNSKATSTQVRGKYWFLNKMAFRRPIGQTNGTSSQKAPVNEIKVQLRVRHKNVVRLIGCCMETEVPMLVFEFIPNGSLDNMLHGSEQRPLFLSERLDIAVGTAEALAFMHSHGLVHMDVKPANILLGDELIPKVSDFGSSDFKMKIDKICGDMNYIDPVCIKTLCFTEKSDVYSFGVVLVELITRKKAKYDGPSVRSDFVEYYMDDNARWKMYDMDMFHTDTLQPSDCVECLDRMAGIAIRCLRDNLNDRLTMEEVVQELKQLRATVQGPLPA